MDIRTKIGNSNFIKATDLCGRPAVVTIDKCLSEMVGQGRDAEEKAVLYFRGKEKGLVLNSTNGTSIGEIHGWETSGWIGNKIELFPTKTEFQGKLVDCIRVRAAAAPAAAEQPGDVQPTTPQIPDEIPF